MPWIPKSSPLPASTNGMGLMVGRSNLLRVLHLSSHTARAQLHVQLHHGIKLYLEAAETVRLSDDRAVELARACAWEARVPWSEQESAPKCSAKGNEV